MSNELDDRFRDVVRDFSPALWRLSRGYEHDAEKRRDLHQDMLVAIWKVHWAKGFFVTKGGYEYPLVLFCVFAVVGLSGVAAYSVDELLGLAMHTPVLFVAVFVVGLIAAVVGGMTRREERQGEAGRLTH